MVLYSLGGLHNEAEGHNLTGKGRDIINSCPFADCSEHLGGGKLMCDHLIRSCIITHMSN